MAHHLETRANLAGRRAALVGGAGGLGRACTLDLARAGVHVALCDRDGEALAATAEEVTAAGVDCLAVEADAREPDALERFMAAVAEAGGGRLDVLVNVVGGTFRQPFAESSRRGWDALIRANFTWLLQATHLAVPLLREAGGGSIVQITSIEAHRAAPNYAVYAAMKAAVTSLTRSLAVELGPEGIRVNCIAPDMVPTGGLGPGGPAPAPITEAQARVGVPMGRLGTAEDVGGCALFLASDLSRYVTGTTLHPDGGALASAGWFNWPEIGFLQLPPPEEPDVGDSLGPDGGDRLTVELTDRQRLALCLRILGARGYQETVTGHWTLRDRDDGTLLVNPVDVFWSAMCAGDLLRVDRGGRVLEGTRQFNPTADFHFAVHDRRPDVRAVLHNHPPFGGIWAAAARIPPLLDQSGANGGGRVTLVSEYDGTLEEEGRAKALAAALGRADVAVLAHHGVLVTGPDLETVLVRALSFEWRCQRAFQVTAMGLEPRELDASVAEEIGRSAHAYGAVLLAVEAARIVEGDPSVLEE